MSADSQLAPAAQSTGARHDAAGVLLAVAGVLMLGGGSAAGATPRWRSLS